MVIIPEPLQRTIKVRSYPNKVITLINFSRYYTLFHTNSVKIYKLILILIENLLINEYSS